MSHQKKDFDKLKRGKYLPDNLKKATSDVINGILTAEEAKKKYGVPTRTIQDHVKYVINTKHIL